MTWTRWIRAIPLTVALLGLSPLSARAAATSLVATAVSNSGINLRWSGATQGWATFGIDRSLSATTGFTRIGTVQRTLSYEDRGLVAGRTYYYRVTDLRLGGTSNVASATTFGVPTTSTTSTSSTTSSSTTSSSTTSSSTTSTSRTSTSTTSTSRTSTSTISISTSTSSTSNTVSTSTTSTRTTTTTSTTLASAPVANAGPDQFSQTLTALAFNGSGSFDPGGTITSYAWTFGDGTGASGMAPTHAYPVPGTYVARLTVMNNSGLSASDTATVSIANRAPSANAGPDQSAGVGASVTFAGSGSDLDGVVTSYTWNFGDSASASGATASHAYTVAGTYVATLTVTDDRGATGTDAVVITVGTGVGGSVVWGKLLGTSGIDAAEGVAVDEGGNVIVTGSWGGATALGGVPCLAGSLFVSKLSPGGTWLWSRCPGGIGGGGKGRAVAVDANGDVVVTGGFMGTVDFGGGPLTAGGYGHDIFVVKYSSAGGHVWSKSLGASNGYLRESGNAVAVDGVGDVVVTGSFDGPADFGGGVLSCAGGTDVFVAKFSGASGAHLWSRQAGSAGWNDAGRGVAVDGAGNVLVTGTAAGGANFGGGPLSGTDLDVFVVKYNAAGGHVWSRSFGSAGVVDSGAAVGVDAAGNALVTGSFKAWVDFGAGPIFSRGDSDIFLAKLSPLGASLWWRTLGDRGIDTASGLSVGATGDVAITGSFGGIVDFGTGPLTALSTDLFVARYSSAGAPQWSRRLGGSGSDVAYALGMNRTGQIAVAGNTLSGAVDFGGGPIPNAGQWDGLLVALTP